MNETRDFVTLGEIAELNSESLGTKTPGYYTFTYIDLSSVSNGSIDVASLERFQFSRAPSRARRVVRDGDVLFGTVRPQLRSHARVQGDDHIASTGFCVVRPKIGVSDGGFLSHYLLSDEATREAVRREVGSNYPAVTERDLAAFRLRHIPFEEQCRIAEVLDSIDETIQAAERVIAKRKAVRAGLASDLLNGRVGVAGGENRNTNETPSPVPVAEAGRQVTDGWSCLRLGDLGAVVGGNTPSRESPQFWGGTVPWLTPGELTDNSQKFVFDTQDHITEYGLSTSGARLLPKDTLMVTSRASLGSVALAGRPMATNQGFKNLIPGPGVDSSYLFHLGRTLGREMLRRASGTTFLEVSGREFGQMKVWVPPLEEQRRIAEILDAADDDIEADEMRLVKLRELRAGLAADLLSGRVRTVAV